MFFKGKWKTIDLVIIPAGRLFRFRRLHRPPSLRSNELSLQKKQGLYNLADFLATANPLISKCDMSIVKQTEMIRLVAI